MAELKARLAQVSAAYEPDWGRNGERMFRRAVLAAGTLMIVAQLL